LLEEEFVPFIETIKTTRFAVPTLRDSDDAKFITCAAAAGVRWLVTGDDDFLNLRRVKSVEIATITTFLQYLKQRS
jgi:predicted nucleic acid-binding protein